MFSLMVWSFGCGRGAPLSSALPARVSHFGMTLIPCAQAGENACGSVHRQAARVAHHGGCSVCRPSAGRKRAARHRQGAGLSVDTPRPSRWIAPPQDGGLTKPCTTQRSATTMTARTHLRAPVARRGRPSPHSSSSSSPSQAPACGETPGPQTKNTRSEQTAELSRTPGRKPHAKDPAAAPERKRPAAHSPRVHGQTVQPRRRAGFTACRVRLAGISQFASIWATPGAMRSGAPRRTAAIGTRDPCRACDCSCIARRAAHGIRRDHEGRTRDDQIEGLTFDRLEQPFAHVNLRASLRGGVEQGERARRQVRSRRRGARGQVEPGCRSLCMSRPVDLIKYLTVISSSVGSPPMPITW